MQVFDSWVGALDAADYREFVLPHVRRIFDALADLRRADDPLRHRHRRTCSRVQREAGGDVIGVDWRTPLDEAWRARWATASRSRATSIPTLLLAPRERLLARVDDVLRARRRAARPHLQPRPRHPARHAGRRVKAVVDHVHEATSRRGGSPSSG